MPTQFALESSAYVPLAIGFFGLAGGLRTAGDRGALIVLIE